jgi:hypothetical protein
MSTTHEHEVIPVTVTHLGVKYTVDVNQDLADVIDDLMEDLYAVYSDYETVGRIADVLGQRAINQDPR